MKYKVIKTDLRLNGKHVSENSVIELSSADYQKHKKDLAPFLFPFFDDALVDTLFAPSDSSAVDSRIQLDDPFTNDEPLSKPIIKESTRKRLSNKRNKKT